MATLGFSTQWPKQMGGGNTEFIPKIWKGIYANHLAILQDWDDYENKAHKQFGSFEIFNHSAVDITFLNEKLHTIREDKKNLWVPGRQIHMVVFNRTKNRFQFAPILEVKSVQKISISHKAEKFEDWLLKPVVRIDDNILLPEKVHVLAVNDGFNGISDFFQWFNHDFQGKIIHWTDLKY